MLNHKDVTITAEYATWLFKQANKTAYLLNVLHSAEFLLQGDVGSISSRAESLVHSIMEYRRYEKQLNDCPVWTSKNNQLIEYSDTERFSEE